MDCYIIELSFSWMSNCSYFLIWYEDKNGKNCIYNSDGKIIAFSSEEKAKKQAQKLDFNVCGIIVYDAEHLEYLMSVHSKEIEWNCEFLLDFWNMFEDIAYSVGIKIEPVRTKCADRCYNKLFYGANLPTITPEDCRYKPIFTRKERKYIRNIMNRGLKIYFDNYRLVKFYE